MDLEHPHHEKIASKNRKKKRGIYSRVSSFKLEEQGENKEQRTNRTSIQQKIRPRDRSFGKRQGLRFNSYIPVLVHEAVSQGVKPSN